MNEPFEASVDKGVLRNGEAAVCLKLSSATVEVNVWFTRAEATALGDVLALEPQARGLPIGVSASSRVHWGRDDERHVYLLVGDDDETWDIGITLSDATFRLILDEIAKHRARERKSAP